VIDAARGSNRRRTVSVLVGVAAAIAGGWPAAASAATQPRLGTALNFAVLAGSTITNTGSSVITGDLGLHAGTAVTGFPPGTVTGVKHVADAVALQAKNDLTTAYDDAASSPSTSDLTGQDLGGKDLTPGVYTYSSSAQLTGPLTLNGNGVFVFRIGSTLTTASNSAVLLTNGAQACAVFWQVGSSATLGSATQFQGNLMALTSITMVTGANILTGRALARNGALTLDTNRITPPAGTCTTTSTTTTTPSPPGSTPPVGLGQTGGGPPPQPGFPWWPVATVGALGALLAGLRISAARRNP
jgi:type VI secretion system secreted protein VgrG